MPTVHADDAVSLRGLSFTLSEYLGHTIDVRALVRSMGTEQICQSARCGVEMRLVDRTIDEQPSEFPALLVGDERPAVDSRVRLLANVVEHEQLGPMLLVHAIADDPDPITSDSRPNWRPVAGSPSPLPEPREVPTLLREGAGPLPLELASTVDEAMGLVSVAALADHGQLAELHARRAVSLDPKDSEAWSLLAAIYGGYAHFDHQLAALAAGSKQCPEALNLWFQWGQRAIEAGKFADAIAPLEYVLGKEPDSIPVNFYLGTAYWLDDKREQAKPYYQKVMAIHEARPVHTANEFKMIMTAENRLAEMK